MSPPNYPWAALFTLRDTNNYRYLLYSFILDLTLFYSSIIKVTLIVYPKNYSLHFQFKLNIYLVALLNMIIPICVLTQMSSNDLEKKNEMESRKRRGSPNPSAAAPQPVSASPREEIVQNIDNNVNLNEGVDDMVLANSYDDSSSDYEMDEQEDDTEIQFKSGESEKTQGGDPASSTSCDDILNTFIEEHYGVKKTEEHIAPPISELLATTMNSWCLKLPEKSDIKFAFEQCRIPANVKSLAQIKINEVIYQRLPFRAKEQDRQARNRASYYTRPLGPLSFIWDTFIKAEAFAIKNKNNPPALKIENEVIPLRSLIACLSASVKLLCYNIALQLNRRKGALKQYLDPKYHTLAGPSNPITQFLFGDNLEQRVSEIFRIAQAARNNRFQAVRARRPFFSGRSRFRGGGRGARSYPKRSSFGSRRPTTAWHSNRFNRSRNNRFPRLNSRGRPHYNHRS